MEFLLELAHNYSNVWRHTLSKKEYMEEFGELTEEEWVVHNLKVLENHNFFMDVIKKLNTLDENVLTEETSELIANIIRECEEFKEKDFITIY